MQPHMQASLVTDALRMAWFMRQPGPGLIFHSDRGSQYCGNEFQDALKAYGMKSSMSRKGNCWDNAPTESLWGRLKVGRLYGKTFATQRDAMDEIIDWLTFYNHRRLHSTLDYVSPMRFEKNWHAAQQDSGAQSSGYGVRTTGARSLRCVRLHAVLRRRDRRRRGLGGADVGRALEAVEPDRHRRRQQRAGRWGVEPGDGLRAAGGEDGSLWLAHAARRQQRYRGSGRGVRTARVALRSTRS